MMGDEGNAVLAGKSLSLAQDNIVQVQHMESYSGCHSSSSAELFHCGDECAGYGRFTEGIVDRSNVRDLLARTMVEGAPRMHRHREPAIKTRFKNSTGPPRGSAPAGRPLAGE